MELIKFPLTKKEIGDIYSRSEDIKTVCNDMILLQQMFVDLNNIINQQGDSLDITENDINNIKNNVEQAETELIVADEYQSSTSRIKNILFGIVTIVSTYIGIRLYN